MPTMMEALPAVSYAHFSRQFRQLFDEIGRGDRAREAGRHLPIIPLEQLRDAGLGAVTVSRQDPQQPVASFETVLRLMMDLATEDVNVAHMWRRMWCLLSICAR